VCLLRSRLYPLQSGTENPPADQKASLNTDGTVKAFEVGKSIEVDVKGTATSMTSQHGHDLHDQPDVKVGMTVKLMESKDLRSYGSHDRTVRKRRGLTGSTGRPGL